MIIVSFNIPPVIIHAFHPSIICDGDECSNVNISREKCEWMIWNTCICQSCHTINYEFIGWMKTQKYNSVHFQTSNSNIIITLYPCTEYHFYFLSFFFWENRILFMINIRYNSFTGYILSKLVLKIPIKCLRI